MRRAAVAEGLAPAGAPGSMFSLSAHRVGAGDPASTGADGFQPADRIRADRPVRREGVTVSVESEDGRTSTAGTAGVDEAMVEQAKGILAVMFAITPDEALLLMQAFAGQEFPSLADVADHVVSVATEPPGFDVDLVRERLTLLLFADGATL